MNTVWYNEREKYTDLEIASMMKQKMLNENININQLYEKYLNIYNDLTLNSIEAMFDGVSYFNLQMLEIASDYLSIDFDELSDFIQDDCSIEFRFDSKNDQEASEFCEIINILFSEMIENRNLVKFGEKLNE
ncbi:TPA: hypothetical protein I9080_003002 [Clostridium perfringens]|mgnify:CR=1 FL=1|uniref:DNA-binding protein n=1 Tax=Clostridium perfringens TaxID=1502 RepID=A0A8H9R2C8_CLOPF|nr:hypothetical protein [Clostridium perfringens]